MQFWNSQSTFEALISKKYLISEWEDWLSLIWDWDKIRYVSSDNSPRESIDILFNKCSSYWLLDLIPKELLHA